MRRGSGLACCLIDSLHSHPSLPQKRDQVQGNEKTNFKNALRTGLLSILLLAQNGLVEEEYNY